MRRRDALHLIGTGLPALAIAGSAERALADEGVVGPRRRLRVALVGLGSYAAFCAPRLARSRRAELAGFVTGDAAKGRRWAEQYDVPAAPVFGYGELERLRDDERIDAVHICLPVGLHAEFAERALAAGKHVLCEKPLAATVAEAQRLATLARTAGLRLMPAYRARYSNVLDAAFAAVASGEHGRLVAVDAHKGFAMELALGNWRFDPLLAGGGCLWDIGIYSVQLIRWATGAMPLRVRAMRAAEPSDDPRFARVESHVAWMMEMPDGVVATGSASWRYHLQNHARLACERAWLRIEPATPAIGERLFVGRGGPLRVEEPSMPAEDQLPKMYDDFAAAALDGASQRVPPEDGVADLIVLEALRRAAEGGETVEIPPLV